MQAPDRSKEQAIQERLEPLAEASVPDVLREIHSSPKGLTAEEAARRLKEYGPNAIAGEKRSALMILREQFANGMTLMLLAAAIVTGIVGDLVDGAIIFTLLLLNVSLGFIQEYRSERAIADLRHLIEVYASVMRDGRELKILAEDLVPGDIVVVKAGGLVPADLRLIEGEELEVNQAALTGESMWQPKDPAPLRGPPSSLGAMSDILFSGTSVVAGTGKGVVIGTGPRTAFGRTASLLRNIRGPGSFQQNLTRFGGFLLRFALFLTVVVFVANALLGRNLLVSLTLSLALALGMVPEALPAVTITSLSLGAAALAQNKVVVRRLAAVEDFSAVDVLCTDKTGTITQNRIAVTDIWSDSDREEVLIEAVLCSSFPEQGEHPVDDAIIRAAKKRNLDLDQLAKVERFSTIPFTSTRKRMSVVARKPAGEGDECEMITKGAAAVVLARCSHIRRDSQEVGIGPERAELEKRMKDAAELGNTVLAVAVKPLSKCRKIDESDEQDLTLLGYIMVADPLRPGVEGALHWAEQLGLEVKIITGDSRYTATALARAVGLPSGPGDIVLGSELHDARKVAQLVETADIFAEVVPEDKYRIVRALQANGHQVAVTGDGINDAPALKAANVGIAVQSGTDVAKDASDMILLENNLGVIVDGLREGRRIFTNINRYLLYTMVSNFANVLIVAVASLFLSFIPLLPAQVLLLSILSDLPMLSVATDNVSIRQLAKPLRWDIRQIIEPAIYLGITNALFAFGLLRFFVGAPPEEIRTAWYLLLAITSILILFPVRTRLPIWKAVPPSWPVVAAVAVGLLASLLLIQFPFTQAIFGFVPLPGTWQLAISGYALLYVAVGEGLLLAYYRHVGAI